MNEKDIEALTFLEAVPVHPKTISRTELMKKLQLTFGQLNSLIYRCTWYMPIAEENRAGLCWPTQAERDETERRLRNGLINWPTNGGNAPSALRRRLFG